MKERIEKILSLYQNEYGLNLYRTDEIGGKHYCCAEIRQMFQQSNIPCIVSVDEMCENTGYDVDALSIAWVENGQPQLYVDRLCYY